MSKDKKKVITCPLCEKDKNDMIKNHGLKKKKKNEHN